MTYTAPRTIRRTLASACLATMMALGMVATPLAQPADAHQTASVSTASASASGQRAADHARSLLGSRYSWGATGGGAYDCSGVTQAAWRAAGIDIPRVSRDQSDSLRSVSRSELRPGDLVFFNRPVSHVAIYVGNGEIVEASRSRGRVATSTLAYRSGVVGYGRP